MKRIFLSMTFCLTFSFVAFSANAEMPLIELKAGKQKLTAEVANTDPDRIQGLMHRRMLPENRGMLFVFPNIGYHGIWMKNTFIPLSVAFIDDKGVIVNIEDMQPQTLNAHCAKKPARFALEMNQGWFRQKNIRSGVQVTGLPQ